LWYGVVNMDTGKRTGRYFGALEAFMPGLLAISGDMSRAQALENSCYTMWNLAGIEPEVIEYDSMKIVYPGYQLRPEIIESAFYLHRLTGDEQYRRMGMTFFNSLKKYCRTDFGYAALVNVQTKEKRDMMESFFFAETMKYLYLLFADRSDLNVEESVFNTEAHPIRKTWQ
jgi:mannosidase alpha-like ER degradation enhancer 2